jgi:hypothetical protein
MEGTDCYVDQRDMATRLKQAATIEELQRRLDALRADLQHQRAIAAHERALRMAAEARAADAWKFAARIAV